MPLLRDRIIFIVLLAIICMPFLPQSLIRPATNLIRPTVDLRRLPRNATRFAGFISPLALFSSSSSKQQNEMTTPKVQKSDSEWVAQLSPAQVSLYLEIGGIRGAVSSVKKLIRHSSCSSGYFDKRAPSDLDLLLSIRRQMLGCIVSFLPSCLALLTQSR